MVSETDLRVRQFLPEDYPMICEWAYHHRQARERFEKGYRPPPLEMLPPVAVIVYQIEPVIDLAACWLYLAHGCPACFIDHAVTRPGLKMTRARDALLHCVQYLKFFAARQGYLVMNTCVSPALGRTLERMGWFRGEDNLAQYSSALFEIPAFTGNPQEVT
jgi:hypothetical protein